MTRSESRARPLTGRAENGFILVAVLWLLAALAGVLGATAFTHSAGYFVTFMTGNAQRAEAAIWCR